MSVMDTLTIINKDPYCCLSCIFDNIQYIRYLDTSIMTIIEVSRYLI